MLRNTLAFWLVRRAAVAVGLVALSVTVLAPAQAAVHPAQRALLDTYASWDGSSDVYQFGCPNTTTYGQVITIPAKSHKLNSFSFYMATYNGAGQMVVRGEVYAWDGSMATGSPVAETAPRTIAFANLAYHRETFKVGGVAVTPGAQYVIFASLDKDYSECTGDYTLGWASVDDSVYADGTFVYQNNAGDSGNWTTQPWNTYGIDLAFKACLG